MMGNRREERFVGERFAAAGYLPVVPSYRLSPEVSHPAHIQDVAAAFAWVNRNIRQHGGDPDRIMVIGHSAGAYLAMRRASRRTVRPTSEAPIRRHGPTRRPRGTSAGATRPAHRHRRGRRLEAAAERRLRRRSARSRSPGRRDSQSFWPHAHERVDRHVEGPSEETSSAILEFAARASPSSRRPSSSPARSRETPTARPRRPAGRPSSRACRRRARRRVCQAAVGAAAA